MIEVPRRRRGGQRGNQNALKHGFYARRFKKADVADVEGYEFSGLKDEINVLRIHLRRLIELSGSVDDFWQEAVTLRVLCLACDSLTRLMKAQHFLLSGEDEASAALRPALDEVVEEMKQKGSGVKPD